MEKSKRVKNTHSCNGKSLQQALEKGHQMHAAAGVVTASSLDFHIERESLLLAYTVAAVLLGDSPAQLQGDPHWSKHLKKRVHVIEPNIFWFSRLQRKSVIRDFWK
jgi:hypothetical protein